MSDDQRRDPIFKGCTRPAMVFGVPLVPLGVAVAVLVLLAVWFSALIAIAILPTVAIMRMIAKADDQNFRLLGLKAWFRIAPHTNRNGGFWKASTYSPLPYRKR